MNNTIPKGWKLLGSKPEDYVVNLDTKIKYKGNTSVYLESTIDSNDFGTLMQTFRVGKEYLGKRIELTGYLKTEEVKSVGMWMRVDSKEVSELQFDNMENRRVIGSNDWKQYAIVLDVPLETYEIAFGVLLVGSGKVWMDTFEIKEVDNSVVSTNTGPLIPYNPVNLDFEE